MKLDYDVVIIGAGPAGIAAATELKTQGIHNIIILEREDRIGGSTRHSFLPTFGTLVFKCPMTGPQFTKKILKICGDVQILTGTTVNSIHEGGRINITSSSNSDVTEISGRRVIFATGAYEMIPPPYLPKDARLQNDSALSETFSLDTNDLNSNTFQLYSEIQLTHHSLAKAKIPLSYEPVNQTKSKSDEMLFDDSFDAKSEVDTDENTALSDNNEHDEERFDAGEEVALTNEPATESETDTDKNEVQPDEDEALPDAPEYSEELIETGEELLLTDDSGTENTTDIDEDEALSDDEYDEALFDTEAELLLDDESDTESATDTDEDKAQSDDNEYDEARFDAEDELLLTSESATESETGEELLLADNSDTESVTDIDEDEALSDDDEYDEALFDTEAELLLADDLDTESATDTNEDEVLSDDPEHSEELTEPEGELLLADESETENIDDIDKDEVLPDNSEHNEELTETEEILISCSDSLPKNSVQAAVSPAKSIPSNLKGIMNSDSLQQYINIDKRKPCTNPVIIGTESMSFTSLFMLYRNGIKTKAMLEERSFLTASSALKLLAKASKTPIRYNTKLIEIGGTEQVEYIIVEQNGQQERIECDAVIFTGNFLSNNQLVRNSHLRCDPNTGIPITDPLGRCSDGVYYAIGNILHPADRGDLCYLEGRHVGLAVSYDLKVPPVKNSIRVDIKHDDNILFTSPSCLTINGNKQTFDMNVRVKEEITGLIIIKSGEKVLYKSKRHFLPGRRIMLKNIKTKLAPADTTEINISIVQ